MPKPKSQRSSSQAVVSPGDHQASIAVLTLIVERAREAKGADSDLSAILEKHVLKADPKDNAADGAVSDIQKLAQARAAPTDNKS